ncbi:MAG: DUF3164 family protein [Fibrobacter sp.]|jgi:hypothetical protein|uniref:DUF3164 family protein n=1 Tax=Fibrobacter sp. TaxID=35828 RepID=UPI001B252830|nr:DUF3164 family protein [Fibrobacter sp.]MBO7059850.1 DUF3164 family protein [Fibrobacter sp.]
MATKDKDGNWLDDRGRPVPEQYIPATDKKRDQLVERTFKKVVKLSEKIAETKCEIVGSIDKYLDELAKENRVRENWKGNILLQNFDKSLCIERRIDDNIGFDEKLQMVKTIVDKWIAGRLDGIDENLGKVITQAFNVDKQGRVNTAMLMKLLHLEIEDSEWKKAMRMLKESIIVKSSKQSINFKRKVKKDSGEIWETVVLNFNDAVASEKKEKADDK